MQVSDSNEAAVSDTLLSTVEALLDAERREDDDGHETVEMYGTEMELVERDVGSGDGGKNEHQCIGAVVAPDNDLSKQPGDEMNEGRTVRIAKRYRGQQKELLLRIRKACLDVAKAAR